MKLFIAAIFLLTLGCASKRHLPAYTPPSSSLVVDGKLWSSLFQQRAAEYKALCLQAFTIAKLRVEQWPASTGKPYAIITDIDETFLDNSPYAVHQALAGKDYEPASWWEWTAKASADTLPGALAFFRFAAARQVEIFYITNRDEAERQATLANLQKFGFPYADDRHLLPRQTTSGKEGRRQEVAKTHQIMLLLGDNLSDFSELFDKKSAQERDQHVFALGAEFGNRFIVLPNVTYGGWEDAIYLNQRSWNAQQKDSLIRHALKGY